MDINSKEYWNNRFDTDWELYGGSNQTRFFAELACEMMPEWFIRDVRSHQYTICDMGCAFGDAVDVLSMHFETNNVCGCDFSEEAIAVAKNRYPEYDFFVSDLKEKMEDYSCDIVFCSNVLEHMKKPQKILENFSEIAKRYIVILIPFKEKLEISEHITKFSECDIPENIGDFQLVYTNSLDGAKIPETSYPDQQIFLIYSNSESDKKMVRLSDVTNGTNKSIIRECVDQEIDSLKSELTEALSEVEQGSLTIQKLSQQCEMLEQEKNKNSEEIDSLKSELTEALSEVEQGSLTIQKLSQQCEMLEQEKNKNSEEIDSLKSELTEALSEVEQKNLTIQMALQKCNHMLTSGLFKVVHLINRTFYQGIRGSKEEKRLYRRWIFQHHQTGGDTDRRYNPLFGLIDILNSPMKGNLITKKIENLYDTKSDNFINEEKRSILLKDYLAYDVIIFGVIDYDFRYQRPQHFADRYAANGHRVFYVNANHYNPTNVTEIKKNLFIVNLNNPKYNAIHMTDWSGQRKELELALKTLMDTYCIRDAVTIVDYPNWILAALYLRENYGFKIVTDYMDDFTGFLNPAEKLVGENCKKLLKNSDMIIPSSQFLFDIAKTYNSDISIVRNGTEFEHFNKAYVESDKKNRPVIGYYGAIAEWFDINKVCYLAQNMPHNDIVLIGNITAGVDELKKYSNIKVLGEKPYTELPKYLKDFDVCLIPFDTSTDLIKATNPVKFYEYLSAGKKVVATEIPELMPFRDKFVYMANDNKQFLEYVQMCLDGTDTLAGAEECIAFAKENDWQERYETFAELVKKAVPKVDIIVLTYNNLALNKLCIDSILKKTAYPNYELVIVDNLSTDGTRKYLKQLDQKNLEHVKVILNEENLGFAGGNNVAMKSCTGDYVVLLNNDTIVTRGWLTAMSKHFGNNKELGMCGPVTNAIGNEAKIKAEYHDKDQLELFAYSYTTTHLNEEFKSPNVLALFCTMIKREVMETCGYLDESYGVGMFEDDDYAEAMKNAGYKLTIAEDAFIHHFDGSSFKKLEDERYKSIFEKNKKIFEDKWQKKWVMHHYRKGVRGDDNVDINIL